jgi:hypothetical protein
MSRCAPHRAPLARLTCPVCGQHGVAVMPGWRIPRHGPGRSCDGQTCGRANCPVCSHRVCTYLLRRAGLAVKFPTTDLPTIH